MKKSKRVISLLLSVLMLVSVIQTGFVAFAADGTEGLVLTAAEAAKLPDAGAVTTCTEVVRVASGLYSYEMGTTIVPATPSGIPVMNGSYESNSVANAGSVNETASYPTVKITFKDLPSDVPQITCVNSNSSTNNIVMSSADYNAAEKSYTWILASGTANAGDTIQFKISYTYNSKSYVSTAYAYVENIAQPAGSYVTTESKYESGLFGWGSNYYAGISAVSRVLGINTYGSLESFTTSSSDYRGYYNASANSFVLRPTADYVTYSVSRSQSTKNEDNPLTYAINDRRSYADVYVDSSVTDSFDDLNLRYAITKPQNKGGNTTQKLEFVGAAKGTVNVDGGLEGTGDYELGTVAATGVMNTVGEGTSQYVTTFSGITIEDGAEYTLVAKISSEYNGAMNSTYFPVGLRIHVADKGALRTLVNDILYNSAPETPLVSANYKGVNPQSWYYSDGYSAYETAMLNAQTVLANPRVDQDDISNAISSLTSAYKGLVLAEADYSAATVAYNKALEYEATKDLYTEESYGDLLESISIYDADTNPDGKIQLGYSVIFQPQVDIWESEIYEAIENLEYKSADYSEVEEALLKAREAEENIDMYLDFSSVKAAMNNIDYSIKIIEQEKVDAMADALNEALANLKFKPADYSAVNDAVNDAQKYVASNYTTESYAALRTLLRNIDYTLTVDKQETVDNYVTQINEAIANLDELDADYTELEGLIAHVNGLVKEYYVEETYQAAVDAVAACEGYEEIGITRQDEIDEMVASVQKAVDGLVMFDANYSEVEAAIDEFNKKNLDQITPESIQAVRDAIAAVEYGLKIDRQNDVDNYAQAIYDAIGGLSYEPADYSKVILAQERAANVDRSYWSSGSLAALDLALESVEPGLGVDRQDEVDEMANAINAAIDQLQPGPADYSRVRAAIARFQALNPSHYTPASIDAVANIIDGIDWNLTKAQQDIVNGYAFDISDAMLDLKPAKADYTELERIKESIPDNLESQYTEDSIDAVQDVLSSINWELNAEDQDIVIGYQNALTEAILGLEYLTGDYSDVDAAIAEGRAIIAKNDPPISEESVAEFEKLVTSINRTYTIKQEAEIAALAADIRAAYKQFTYAESIHKASVSLVGDRSATYPEDIVTVSVVIGTDYYAASSSIPVLYDSNFYELVSFGSTSEDYTVATSIEDAYAFEGSYADASKKGGSITSPAKGYPSSYTDSQKAQWKYALITLAPLSTLNADAQILSPAQTVVKLQFRVKDNLIVAEGSSFTARIWIDKEFLKTETNKTGKLYVGRFENETVDNNVISVGQTIDLSKAVLDISVINPNSKASFGALYTALNKTLKYDASYYTEDTYSAYDAAVKNGNEVVTFDKPVADGGYTVKEQYIIDEAANKINAAYDALKLKDATITPLEEALQLTPPHTSDYYTTESYTAFLDAVAKGQAILGESNLTIVDDFRINAAATAIENAFNDLTLKPFSHTDEMEAALSRKPAHGADYYTEDSYKAYTEAYATLEEFKDSNPTFLDDDEGSRLIYLLNQAYNLLYLNDADTSVLEEAISAPIVVDGVEYDSSFFTDETYAEYQAAVDAGNNILNSEERLTIEDQDRINEAATAITNAAAVLEFKPFSKQELIDEAINTSYNPEEEYTQESIDNYWNAWMELAMFAGVDIRDDAEAQRLIDNYYYVLENMEYVLADTSLLEHALSLEVLDEEYYDSETYQIYKNAIAAVEVYGEDYKWKASEQDTVNQLAQDIIDAHAGLKLRSFSKLDELQAAIEVTPEYESKYYQEEAYAEYEAARKAITDMIADAENLTMADDPKADVAIENYNKALEALKSAWADADYSDVEKAISEAGEYNRDHYTNFEIVDEAINAVVYNLNILEQETVNGYAAEIRAAFGKLIAKPGNYDAVEKAKAAANEELALMQLTGIEIDQATVDALNNVIDAVVYDLDITQQSVIDGYAAAIEEATEALDYVSTIVLNNDSVYITEEGFIRGFNGMDGVWSEEEITSNFDKYGDDTRIVVTPTMNGYGTGTLVEHYDGDELVESYIVVVDGDADGDSFAYAFDVTIASTYINEFTEPEEAYVKAAIDLCEDGWLDAIDLTVLINMANFNF